MDPSTEKVMHSRILVVDDEPAILKLLRVLLSRAGFDVITCRNTAEAFVLMEEDSFDCVITDAIMPGMTGFDFVKAIRHHPALGALPILMLTRKREREDVKKAVEAGVSDYLVKPIDEQLLLDKVQRCLKKGLDSNSHIFELALIGDPQKAEIKIACEVVAISETGMTIQTPFPLTLDMDIQILSEIFAAMGLKQPILKFLNCEKVVLDNPVYRTRLSFMGVTEEDAKKVRGWIRREAIRRRK